ncbi:MAG: transglycosylase SLT domain-containing protein [Paracoccaceae bacterium]
MGRIMWRPAALAALVLGCLAPVAWALDLGAAARQGAALRPALALGADGDWTAAERAVAGDPFLSDIVRWRKLRAGQGTVAEYTDLIARWPGLPGRDALATAVLGTRPAARPETPLAEGPARAWAAFSRLYGAREYDEAEAYLASLAGPAALGRPALWSDRRRRLARRAAREGRPQIAYRLAAGHHLTPMDGYDYADLEWLAGWVALRKLSDPAAAVGHFERFEAAVETPISLGRGGYWLGRALEAAGRTREADAAYARAAGHQTSYYGQLAAARIGADGDPALARSAPTPVAGAEARLGPIARLAAVLRFAGEDSLAAQTILAEARRLEDRSAFEHLGAVAIAVEAPYLAVRVAKQAARDGHVIPEIYYPLHPLAAYARDVEPALALSIARQETELNPEAVSRAGARGLMQLMPGTARSVARDLGESYDLGRLTRDWRYNARLGQRYLSDRIGQFGGSYVLAAAAYNAGPRRAEEWTLRFGDPRRVEVDTVDWIETIPFRETRNYVQRVMEGLYVYRARLSGTVGPMTLPTDLARGQFVGRAARRP